MGFKAGILIIFPLFVMLALVFVSQGGTTLTGNGGTSICTNGSANCVSSGSGNTYNCPAITTNGITPCKILPTCNAAPPAGAWCVGDVVTAAYISNGCLFDYVTGNAKACGTFINPGSTVFIPSSVINADLSASGAYFAFSLTGTSGFIAMIGVAVALVSLVGFTAFGSGESAEGIHILFMGGMLLGIWTLLTGLEGFLGSPAPAGEFFNSLNGWLPGIGSFCYISLTLIYVVGFVGSVSRGS